MGISKYTGELEIGEAFYITKVGKLQQDKIGIKLTG
jgi:hypothetical protein